MDRKEYLNQISKSAKPVKKRGGLPDFIHSKIFWGIVGALAFALLIIIVGSVLSGSKEPPQNRIYALLLQIDNTRNSVDEYQTEVKNSTLRGYATSLSSILSNTSSELTAYASAVYKYKPKTVPQKIQRQATEHSDELNNDLFVAKINGDLDNIFDIKMSYEIELIANQEAAILSTATNEDLIGILTPSYESLSNLYDDFNEWTIDK